MKLPLYFDYQATTPLDPEVFAAMEPYFNRYFGNAASKSHAYGWMAEAALERSRAQVAAALGVASEEIFFTSGATESNNLAILGLATEQTPEKNHLITVLTEHRSVLDPFAFLETRGWRVTRLGVDSQGRLDLENLRRAIGPKTLLISVMAANNEIGTLAPLRELGSIAREQNLYFHSDAAQAFGRVSLSPRELGIDLLSISAHKIYGPKGVGALYVRGGRRDIPLRALFYGGGHEGGLRSGTPNVPGAVGLGVAAEKACRVMELESQTLEALRNRLWQGLQEQIDGIQLNGAWDSRLPHNLNFSIPGLRSEAVMMECRLLAMSSGSACSSADSKASHVLAALGYSEERIRGALRMAVGRMTQRSEVESAITLLGQAVQRLRQGG